MATACKLMLPCACHKASSLGRNAAGSFGTAGKNDDGDTRIEANRDRKRDVLHISAESHETDGDHDDPGHQSGEGQPVIAVPLNDAGTKNDEGAPPGRSETGCRRERTPGSRR